MILLSKLNYFLMTIVVFVLLNFCYGFPSRDNKQIENQWENFKKEHGKRYKHPFEESMRKQIFTTNKEKIEKFNLEKSKITGYKLGLNHLSDLTDEEYKQLSNLKVPEQLNNHQLNDVRLEKFVSKHSINFNDNALPESVDWTKVPGRVTEVKSQGDCASSWAFAATGALEGQMIPKGLNSSMSLSEQDLIDCSTKNGKCSGGFYGYAFDDIRELGGIQDDVSYPYTGTNKSLCLFDANKSVFSDDGYIMLPRKDERKLKSVVANYGPVAAGINPSLNGFRHYKSGVYKDDDCTDNNQDITLAVLIVGYGSDPEEGDYWLVKNCWSKSWGNKGYIKIARNSDDMCGIALLAAVPDFL